MKLIDLLVQELPKRGGFPNGYNVACHGSMDFVCFHGGGLTPEVHDIPYIGCDVVTRDQYESAIAASQRPVWDGEGLPPAGTLVELMDDSQS